MQVSFISYFYPFPPTSLEPIYDKDRWSIKTNVGEVWNHSCFHFVKCPKKKSPSHACCFHQKSHQQNVQTHKADNLSWVSVSSFSSWSVLLTELPTSIFFFVLPRGVIKSYALMEDIISSKEQTSTFKLTSLFWDFIW